MLEIINGYLPYVVVGLIGLNLILIIVLMVYTSNVKKLKRRFERFMMPNSKNHNIEELLRNNIELIDTVKAENAEIKASLDSINDRLKTTIQYMSIVRYNTFEDVGGDLSYAIALLDENKNGVVLNSLYYRNGCYTYAKPIVNGESKYQLSEEEEAAIDRALERWIPKPITDKKAKKGKIVFKKKNKKTDKGDDMITKSSSRSNEVAGA